MADYKIINNDGEIEKAGCVVLNDNNEILLVTNKERTEWGMPKGHAEHGETARDVALRETLEETGYEVSIVKEIGDVTYNHGETGEPIRVHYFLAKPITHHNKADEEWEWVNIYKAKTLIRSDGKELLNKILP